MALCRYCEGPEHSGACDREALKAVLAKLREEVRVQRLELQAGRKLGGSGVVMITSLISHRTQKPRIDIQIDDVHTQMDADAAMNVALNILKCCNGAFADAFVFHFLKEELRQTDIVGANIIEQFRDYRENLRLEFEAMQKPDEER